MFHGKFQLFDLKVKKYYISRNNLENMDTPFERASGLGWEMGIY
jgi:hypothetical protein